MYILIHIRLCGQVSDNFFFHPADFRTQDSFFWPYLQPELRSNKKRKQKEKNEFRYKTSVSPHGFTLRIQLCKWRYIRMWGLLDEGGWFMTKSVGIKIWQNLDSSAISRINWVLKKHWNIIVINYFTIINTISQANNNLIGYELQKFSHSVKVSSTKRVIQPHSSKLQMAGMINILSWLHIRDHAGIIQPCAYWCLTI